MPKNIIFFQAKLNEMLKFKMLILNLTFEIQLDRKPSNSSKLMGRLVQGGGESERGIRWKPSTKGTHQDPATKCANEK